jgi:hypothetical protein
MRHIARKNEMTIVSGYGDTDASIEVSAPTPATVLKDAYMDRIAMYDMYYKNSYRLFDFYWNRQSHT